MALFGKKEPVICSVCGNDCGPKHSQHQAQDGTVCQECYSAAGFPASISVGMMPILLLKEQIASDDGLSIVKRYKRDGGQEPKATISSAASVQKKVSFLDELAAEHNKKMRDPVSCPKCGSTQISADKKGFGVGKAVVGAALVGGIGLAAGNIGAKKVRITCLKCGNQWMAGNG